MMHSMKSMLNRSNFTVGHIFSYPHLSPSSPPLRCYLLTVLPKLGGELYKIPGVIEGWGWVLNADWWNTFVALIPFPVSYYMLICAVQYISK